MREGAQPPPDLLSHRTLWGCYGRTDWYGPATAPYAPKPSSGGVGGAGEGVNQVAPCCRIPPAARTPGAARGVAVLAPLPIRFRRAPAAHPCTLKQQHHAAYRAALLARHPQVLRTGCCCVKRECKASAKTQLTGRNRKAFLDAMLKRRPQAHYLGLFLCAAVAGRVWRLI